MQQSAMRFGDIKLAFDSVGLIGEAYKKLNDAAKSILIHRQEEKNNLAEYVKARYIKSGILTEEMTNQNVPYVCKNCDRKNCEYLNSAKSFLDCNRRIK